ncbi:hypothetical protein QWY85_17685 [Neolewinella lacunae]|uniref:SusD/RagB family nutrient-binding outer membrane lipoprotein n=1 Tax=Neolewinella lacunae TaxID=1517758 RepID=A0A923PLV1_9BACT|nr:hypothetical protein [Neolewinella lacunae]MBC6995804.1 hypothetical protein [Neolewinella lacunae]MDN3636503.1 hypothetical protein [Neolewinella lacunae]
MKFLPCFLLLAIGLFACTKDGDLFTDSSPTEIPADDFSARTVEFPGKIPADAYVNTLMMSGTATWQDYDAYYRLEVSKLAGEHYYDNLQWLTLTQTVLHPQFMSGADAATKDFYIQEMMGRHFINEAKVAEVLLGDLLERGATTSEVARLAREVIAINKEYLTEDNYKQYEERNQPSISQVLLLGYTRWGQLK